MTLVAVATVLVGASMGAINGGLVAGLRLPSIVVTLATLVIGRESLRFFGQGAFISHLPPYFQWLGFEQSTGQRLVIGVALGVFVGFAIAMRYLSAGRSVYATGSDPEAARLAGIQPRRVVFAVFVVMGGLTGLYALLNVIQFPAVDPKTGTGLEMQVIAAVVVGGAAVSGGRGTMVGTLLGVLLLGTINPALGFLHSRPEWEKAIQGLIILLAVASDGLLRRRS
jgi:rhamnose transport system permease protein